MKYIIIPFAKTILLLCIYLYMYPLIFILNLGVCIWNWSWNPIKELYKMPFSKAGNHCYYKTPWDWYRGKVSVHLEFEKDPTTLNLKP